MIYLKLIYIYAQISFLSFGGIYSAWAMSTSYFQKECTQKEKCLPQYLNQQLEFEKYFSLSELLPGPKVPGIGMVFYPSFGIAGMLSVIFGLILPGFFFIPLYIKYFHRYENSIKLQHFIKGATIGIISILGLFLWQLVIGSYVLFDIQWNNQFFARIILCVLSAIALIKYKIHPAILVLLGGLAGYTIL